MWDATYSLSGTLRITDTPMGAGDGVHQVGPGTLVLRMTPHEGAGADVELRAFSLQERFTIEPKAVLLSATVTTQATARAMPEATGVLASGTLTADTVRWAGPMRGYRTDGWIRCDGSLCGSFGAPPQGQTDIHSATRPITLAPLRFQGSGKTLQMAGSALVSKDESPRQSTFLTFSGRAKSWVCLRRRDQPN